MCSMIMLSVLGIVAIGTALSVAFFTDKASLEGLKHENELASVAAMGMNNTDANTPASGGLRGKSFGGS